MKRVTTSAAHYNSIEGETTEKRAKKKKKKKDEEKETKGRKNFIWCVCADDVIDKVVNIFNVYECACVAFITNCLAKNE